MNHRSESDGASIARVVIIGAGAVGSTAAYALLLAGTAAEIVLINRDRKLAEGHAQDLSDATLFSHTTRILTGEMADCATADVIIIAAGVHQTPGMRSRLDDLKEGASILRGIIVEMTHHAPRGVVLIASNPVDVLTYAVWRWSGLPASRVIGSGTSLDTARFRRRLGEQYGVAPENVHAYIVGEHGDSQVPVLSAVHIAGTPLEKYCRGNGLPFELDSLKETANQTRTAGFEILRAKGATYYGIATALARIAAAILRDERAVLTVSSLVPAAMGFGEVCLSLPSIIGRHGLARVLPISMDKAEAQAVNASAQVLKQHLEFLGISEGTAA